MNGRTALVTGAAGFVGRTLVRALSEAGYRVRAGVHHANGREVFAGRPAVDPMTVDILDQPSLSQAMAGTDEVFHFAALVDSRQSREHLKKVNVVGTRNVWEVAASCGVQRALYCSTTAVYGLLSSSNTAITEDSRPKSVEPYGNTKLLGETTALDVATRTGLHTTIIRPVAIFGPGEHTPFGRQLRDAAWSKLLLAGGFQGRGFNYVHVEDVAAAAVHLMACNHPSGEVFNVCVNDPISFEDAFQAYIRVLGKAGRSYSYIRFLAVCSAFLHRFPRGLRWTSALLGERHAFRIWHPGFDLNYSSARLLGTSFRFRWTDFETVLGSCVEPDRRD